MLRDNVLRTDHSYTYSHLDRFKHYDLIRHKVYAATTKQRGRKMKNKLSQWLIDYVKKKNGVDLTNVPSDKSWTELNPFRDSIRLSDNVIEFINEKNLSAIKSSMDLVEEQSDKAAKEQRDLNTIKGGK